MSDKLNHQQMWIGLIKVKQNKRDGVLGDADQAYGNAIGLAKNKNNFRSQIKRRLELVELQLLRLENAEPLQQRMLSSSVHKDILGLVSSVNKDKQIAFDVFATFDEDEEKQLIHPILSFHHLNYFRK